jgi:hypothetical protein
MATTRTANRPVVSWLFILAGALLLLDILLAYAAHFRGGWIAVFADLAIAAALLLLFLGRTSSLVLRAAYVVGAVGWAIQAIGQVASVGTAVAYIGLILALLGTLIAGIIGFMRHVFGRNADLAFLIASILIAIEFLDGLAPFLPTTLRTIISAVFAALLVVTGYFLLRRRR